MTKSKSKVKPCPYNPSYSVSTNGDVYNSSGIRLNYLSDTTYPYIRIVDSDGNPLRYPVARLVLETFRPIPEYSENRMIVHLDNDRYNCKLLNLLWFTRVGVPIVDKWENNPDFVYIPGYSNYVINRSGVILDTINNARMKPYKDVYLRINLRTDDGVSRTCLVHRLVAMAFVPLPEGFQQFGKLLVNHKDGNKYNPYYRNLEWCSYKQNLDHALTTGLNGCIKIVYLKDHTDGKITKHLGLTKLAKYIGIDPATACEHIASGSKRLLKGRYQLAYTPDGFSDVKQTRASTVAKKIVVRELSTGVDTHYDSIAAAWRALKSHGLKKTSMKRRMRNPKLYQVPYNGYVLKYVDDPWCIQESHKYTKKPVYVKHMNDSTVVKYDSARECARHLGISADIVWNFLESNKDECHINDFILYREYQGHSR